MKRIFGSPIFGRFFGTTPPSPPDPWKGGEQSYAKEFFEDRLMQAAKDLSSEKTTVKVRYNKEKGCVELYLEEGFVLAQIKVHGEMGSPYGAYITAAYLSDLQRMAIENIFVGRKYPMEIKTNLLLREPTFITG